MKNKLAMTLPSLESAEIEPVATLDHSDALDYGNAEAEAYAREATLDGRELERQQELIEGAFDDVASVESLIEAIEEARDVGLEMGSAQFMQLHLNRVQQCYGVQDINCAVPALESFEGRRARLATSISLESVKETLKKIWEWIKEQFRNFIALMRKFYEQITKSLELVEREADQIEQKTRRMKFEGGEKIPLGRAAKKIVFEGEITKDFTSRLNQVAALTHIGVETLAEIRAEVVDRLRDEGLFSRKVPIPKSFTKVVERPKFSQGADALNVYLSPQLPGDIHIAIQTFGFRDSDSAYDVKSGRFIDARVITGPAKDRKEAPAEAEALSSAEIFTLCQRLQKTVAQLKTSRGAAEEHFKKLAEEVEKIGRERGEERQMPEVLKKLLSWSLKRSTIYAGPLFRHCEKVAFDVCVGYLAYAKRSIAHAEAKEKKANEEGSMQAPMRALPASA